MFPKILVPKGRFELPRVAPHGPKPCASASSATSANLVVSRWSLDFRLKIKTIFLLFRASACLRHILACGFSVLFIHALCCDYRRISLTLQVPLVARRFRRAASANLVVSRWSLVFRLKIKTIFLLSPVFTYHPNQLILLNYTQKNIRTWAPEEV